MVFPAALVLASTAAHAGSADYCRPYARDVTQAMIEFIWNRAYTECLNVEGPDPQVPATWQDAWKVVDPTPVQQPADRFREIKSIGVVPATGDPDEQPLPPKPKVKKAKAAVDWSACRKYYPASFRTSDGTVIRKKGQKRVKCPLAA